MSNSNSNPNENGARKKPGRKRCEETSLNIMKAALSMLEEKGFSHLTIEGVAARAAVGKTTIYRWWPNKATLVMDSFLKLRQGEIRFVDTGDAVKDMRDQVHRAVALFSGRDGKTIAGLLGCAQTDPELSVAFRQQWFDIRRKEAVDFLQAVVKRGDFPKNLEIETFLDAVYGPILMRMMVTHLPLTTEFADTVLDAALKYFVH